MPSAARFKRIAPYVLVGAGSAYLYYVAAQIQYHERAGILGPDFWPKAILALALVTCAGKIVTGLLAGRRGDIGGVLEAMMEEAERHGAVPAGGGGERHPWLLAGGMALSALYVWAVTPLGFFTATVPYLAAFMALGGYRRWGVIAATSLVGTLLLLFLFMKLVYVSLPIGQGVFAQVTLLLMQLLGIR